MSVEKGLQSETEIRKLKPYLSQYSEKELSDLFAYGEEMKKRGEQKKRNFWANYNEGSNTYFKKLLIYRFEHKAELESKYKYLDEMTGIEREKFIEEYLYDDILYSGKFYEIENERWGDSYDILHWRAGKVIMGPGVKLDLSSGNLGEDGAKDIADNLELQELVELGLGKNQIGDEGAKAIAQMKLKEGVVIGLPENEIGDRGAEALSKMDLRDGVTLWLGHNEIGDEGAKAIAKNMKLKEGVCLGLSHNNIGDEGAEAISNMELKEGVALDLCNNNIGDRGIRAIMKNLELKSGAVLFLRGNNISDEVRDALRKRKKSYEDKGIDCEISF